MFAWVLKFFLSDDQLFLNNCFFFGELSRLRENRKIYRLAERLVQTIAMELPVGSRDGNPMTER